MKIIQFILLIIYNTGISIGQSYPWCEEGYSLIKDNEEYIQCVPDSQIIENCLVYNANDETKCFLCVGGAVQDGISPNINSCDCTGKPVRAYSQHFRYNDVCVVEIANCNYYNHKDPSKCFSCYGGSIPTGSPKQYSKCDCRGKPNIGIDMYGEFHCLVNLIPNCDRYHRDDTTKCSKCKPGAIANASSGSITVCDCTGKPFTDGVDQYGAGICAAQAIDNCIFYSSSDTSKCNQCIYGAIPNNRTSKITLCACESPNILSVDQDGDSVCIQEYMIVLGCKVYYIDYDGSDNFNKCYSCADGFELQHFGNDQCVCVSGSIPKLDENRDRICVPQIIDNCKLYSNIDPSKCYSCNTGYVETGGSAGLRDSCDCTGNNLESLDEDGESICVSNFIEDCANYNSKNQNKCHKCLPGFTPQGISPQITQCDCDPFTHTRSVDKIGNTICIKSSDLVENCLAYNKNDLTRCEKCILGTYLAEFTHDGSTPDCECAPPSQIKKTEIDGVLACIPHAIEGCSIYSSSNIYRCHTCGDDFTYKEIQEGNSLCICTDDTKVYAVDENNQEFCGANIANCQIWSSKNKNLCHTCETPYSGNGENNDHTQCVCSDPSHIIVTDEVGDKHCSAEIKFCQIYFSNELNKCFTCDEFSIKSDDGSSCDCDRIGIDENDNDICVPHFIQNCSIYNSQQKDKCYTCIEGIFTKHHNQNSNCPCNQVGKKIDKSKLCPISIIENCLYYADPYSCLECRGNFKLADGMCTCPAENQVKDTSLETICVDNVIESCLEYVPESQRCNRCYHPYLPNRDGSECVDQFIQSTTTTSGSIIFFSLVILVFVGVVLVF